MEICQIDNDGIETQNLILLFFYFQSRVSYTRTSVVSPRRRSHRHPRISTAKPQTWLHIDTTWRVVSTGLDFFQFVNNVPLIDYDKNMNLTASSKGPFLTYFELKGKTFFAESLRLLFFCVVDKSITKCP